jgi:phage terminase large subunit
VSDSPPAALPAAPEYVRFVPTPKQAEFQAAVASGQYRHLLYGGAAGGGKTYVLCATVMVLCRVFPGSRWAIVRADLPRIKKTVLPTWNRIAPRPFFEDVHRTDWYVKAANGSEVLFLPASEDIDPDFQRIRGLELNGAAIEECDEVSEAFIDVLSSRLGRWKCPGEVQPLPMSLYSCNPNQRWPKTRFYDAWRNNTLAAKHFYLPAKITDNPHVSKDYLEQLESLPPKQRSVYFDGNWQYADEPDQLIKAEWVEACFERTPDLKGRPKALGVDVARYGDDDTVIASTVGWHLAELEAFHGIDTHHTAELAKARIVVGQIPNHMVRVDTVGLGAGVADNLLAARIKCTEFIAGAKPAGLHKFLHFKNLRSEAWWNMRELCKEGPASFASDLDPEHKRLLTADLTAPRYSLDSDKTIEVESKDSIKARIGRSTDFGDAVVMAYAQTSGVQGYWNAITTR